VPKGGATADHPAGPGFGLLEEAAEDAKLGTERGRKEERKVEKRKEEGRGNNNNNNEYK
jgi:hypothetical protein